MKELIVNLILFVVFCIAFSSLEGCTGGQGNAPAINGYVAGSNPPANKGSIFPPITAGMAAVDIEAL